jgi:hypothetical protein
VQFKNEDGAAINLIKVVEFYVRGFFIVVSASGCFFSSRFFFFQKKVWSAPTA